MDLNAIREKIRKLLALSLDKGASEAEAMNAGALAAKLIARYGVEVAMGDHAQGVSAPSESFERHVVYTGKGPFGVWQGTLADAVCSQAKLSWIFFSEKKSHRIEIIGPLDEASMAGDLLVWLISEVRRLQEEANERGECPKLPQYARGGGRRFWNGWRTGCTMRIKKRMQESRKELADEIANEAKALGTTQAQERYTQKYSLAIKSLDTRIARIDEWWAAARKDQGITQAAPVRRSTGAGDGFQKGYAAGANATLNAAKKLRG